LGKYWRLGSETTETHGTAPTFAVGGPAARAVDGVVRRLGARAISAPVSILPSGYLPLTAYA